MFIEELGCAKTYEGGLLILFLLLLWVYVGNPMAIWRLNVLTWSKKVRLMLMLKKKALLKWRRRFYSFNVFLKHFLIVLDHIVMIWCWIRMENWKNLHITLQSLFLRRCFEFLTVCLLIIKEKIPIEESLKNFLVFYKWELKLSIWCHVLMPLSLKNKAKL